ncbi:MAG: hypothetical protein KGD66_09395 [Candidatus Lokiarchaeota archaeon]|nr:hypothetical protein [Candidatus Lokiarchaeota archaeon]
MIPLLYKKYRIILILFILLLIPVLTSHILEDNKIDRNYHATQELPKPLAFSLEDYEPILEDGSQNLGNITVSNIIFDEKGFYNNSVNYPDLQDDFSTGALRMAYQNTSYLYTTLSARYDNLDQTTFNNKITVVLNESISVEYNYSKSGAEGYLIYGFRLSPILVKEVFIHNQSTDPIEKLDENQYSIDSSNFMSFNYYDYFQVNEIDENYENNFTMYIKYEYNLTINNWFLDQISKNHVIRTQEKSFSPRFVYNFTFGGLKWNETSTIIRVPAYNLKAFLEVNLPDKEVLFNHSLEVSDLEISNYLGSNNVINMTSYAEYDPIEIQFSANFTLRFENPLDFSWAIDRLIENRDIRERIYFPSIISGPDKLIIRYITLFESTITLDQVMSNYSIFKRPVSYFDANVSIIQDELENSLIFTKNSIKKKGLKIIIPYCMKGETNPFVLKYKATKDLRLIITDNINMPLTNVKLELFYFDKLYGTYISNDLLQPMAPAFTNENGEIIISNVPNGIYNAKIYLDDQLLLETEVTPFQDINYVVTDIFHFPIVILVLGSLFGIIILIGFIYHLKNRSKR